MSTLLFVLAFVGLGLGVLFLAMSGSRRGAKEAPRESESKGRRSRQLSYIGFGLALVILGFGVPAAVIASINSRDSIPEANVSNLTAAEKNGRQLFGQHCKNCHSLAAAGAVARVGPNLDQLSPPRVLVLDAIDKGRARGNGQMAPELLEGKEAEDVASFVAKAVGKANAE